MLKTIMTPVTLLAFLVVVIVLILALLVTVVSLLTGNLGAAGENAFYSIALFASSIGLLYSLKNLAEEKY